MTMKSDVFVELELHGPSDQAVAFVEGFRLATEYAGPVWYAGRERVRLEDLLDTLRQKLHRGTHVILRRGLADRIVSAIEDSDLLQLKVDSIDEIAYAELPFEYRCFSRDDGSDLRRVVEEALPHEVRLEGYKHEECVEERAKGPELYSPMHDYTLCGKGRYVGPVAGVIEMAHRLADQDFIHTAMIKLHHPK